MNNKEFKKRLAKHLKNHNIFCDDVPKWMNMACSDIIRFFKRYGFKIPK